MMSLVKRVTFAKWARRLFLAQVYFRHGDHISEVTGCYLWMVGHVGKIDGLIFLDMLGEVYF